jgi:hypothetical protein
MSAINEVLDAIASRFKSGNSIPVERVHITTAELSRLQSSLAEKDETIAELRARCEAAERDAESTRSALSGVLRLLNDDDEVAFVHGMPKMVRRDWHKAIANARALAAQHAQRKEKGR